MDIFRFINSGVMRKHLKDMGYEFSSLEAAWLIYQCHSAPISEKHAAWKELIETMPDFEIAERFNTVPQKSLHAFLKKYMELEDRLIREFCDESYGIAGGNGEKSVYRFEYQYDGGFDAGDYGTIFSRFDALYEPELKPDEDDDVLYIRCTKMQLDNPESEQHMYLSPSFEIMKLMLMRFENEEDRDIYEGVLDGLCFDFPTPFHKGDIVWNPEYPSVKSFCGGPLVLNEIPNNYAKAEGAVDSLRKNGDSSDMCYNGYFLSEEGNTYFECMDNYMDLEFYPKKLTGKQKTLIALSNCHKGEIGLELFAKAYHQIITAGYAADSIPLGYTEAGMVLAGLSASE